MSELVDVWFTYIDKELSPVSFNKIFRRIADISTFCRIRESIFKGGKSKLLQTIPCLDSLSFLKSSSLFFSFSSFSFMALDDLRVVALSLENHTHRNQLFVHTKDSLLIIIIIFFFFISL